MQILEWTDDSSYGSSSPSKFNGPGLTSMYLFEPWSKSIKEGIDEKQLNSFYFNHILWNWKRQRIIIIIICFYCDSRRLCMWHRASLPWCDVTSALRASRNHRNSCLWNSNKGAKIEFVNAICKNLPKFFSGMHFFPTIFFLFQISNF